MIIDRVFTVDTRKAIAMSTLRDELFMDDENAHRIVANVVDREIIGNAAGYFVRADGYTVLLDGVVDDPHNVSVVLSPQCYDVPGYGQVCIRLTDGDSVTTLLAVSVKVRQAKTDAIIDPEHVIPSLDELLAKIADLERATADAERVSGPVLEELAELKSEMVFVDDTDYTEVEFAEASDVNRLSESITEIEKEVYIPSVNIFDKSDITVGLSLNSTTGRTYEDNSDTYTDANRFVSNQIFEIKNGDVIYTNKCWGTFNFYDANKKTLAQISNGNLENTVTLDNAKYLRYGGNNTDTYVKNFMLSINHPLPEEYVAYGKKSRIDEIEEKIGGKVIDKAIILLDFDQRITGMDDNRVLLMENYGYKPTFVGAVDDSVTSLLLSKGWDLSTYSNVDIPPYATINSTSQSDINAWDEYVRKGLKVQADKGFTNPILWSCCTNTYGTALEKALIKYGYKIARGGTEKTTPKELNRDFTQTYPLGIYSNNWSSIKDKIDWAISSKKALNIFTHLVVDTSAEDRGYDCLKSVYVQMLDYIKSKEENGDCVVINYREWYAMQYPKESAELDYRRMMGRFATN